MQRAGALAALVVCALSLSACVSGKSLQDRHHMSRLIMPDAGEDIVFEASVSPDYPLDSELAEQERRRWMQQWLDRTGTCPNGFEVLQRVRLGDSADNPYRHDLRYTLRCRGV